METRDCQKYEQDREGKMGNVKGKLCFPGRFFKEPGFYSCSHAKNNNSLLLHTCLPWETNTHLGLFLSNKVTSSENLNCMGLNWEL